MKSFCAANIKKMIIGLLLTMGSSISANATDYDVDIEGMHAFIQFRIVHLGYSVMIGRFNDFGGNFSWDKNNPGASSINIDVKTKSVDTNHAEREINMFVVRIFLMLKNTRARALRVQNTTAMPAEVR